MDRKGVKGKLAGALVGLAVAVALGSSAVVALEGSIPLAGAAPAQSPPRTVAGDADKIQPVDINTADIDKLMTLRGIGKALAQRIIEYRKEHGPFKKVDDLLNIRGIGERSLERFRDQVTIGSKA